MYIPSSKKDVILTAVFCVMMLAIVLLCRSNSIISDKLFWALQDVKMANMKIDSDKGELSLEKALHAYTKERLEYEKMAHETAKESLACEKRLTAQENMRRLKSQ